MINCSMGPGGRGTLISSRNPIRNPNDCMVNPPTPAYSRGSGSEKNGEEGQEANKSGRLKLVSRQFRKQRLAVQEWNV